MGIWKTIKAAFAPGTSTPPDARRLSAVDELALSASLRALPVGERGWITLSEANAGRMRSSACDTLIRLCVRHVLCWFAFPLVPALPSPDSAADCSVLYAGFPATMARSDFSGPCIIGYGSSPSRCGPVTAALFRSDPIPQSRQQ